MVYGYAAISHALVMKWSYSLLMFHDIIEPWRAICFLTIQSVIKVAVFS